MIIRFIARLEDMTRRHGAQIRHRHVERDGDGASSRRRLVCVEPGDVEGVPGGRATREDEECVEGPVAFCVGESLEGMC